ncbi:hypothetical protein PI125_g20668 [Phytophthora idaei]|nr:hypothetical protein PI125_g20668 [Phytophthora idaei]
MVTSAPRHLTSADTAATSKSKQQATVVTREPHTTRKKQRTVTTTVPVDRELQVETIRGSDGQETTERGSVQTPRRDESRVDSRERRLQRDVRGQALQVTDTEIVDAQRKSRLVQKLKEDGVHRGMQIKVRHGLVLINTSSGRWVVLPPALWPVVFKECRDSVWAGHLRATHTYARIAQLYWWPNLMHEVRQWGRGCQECGSRKARPREIVPALRSINGGDVGDRWTLDVAGPLPTSNE